MRISGYPVYVNSLLKMNITSLAVDTAIFYKGDTWKNLKVMVETDFILQ